MIRLYRLEIWIWNNISEDYEIISEDYEISPKVTELSPKVINNKTIKNQIR